MLARFRNLGPWQQAFLVVGLGLTLRIVWMLFASPVPVSDYEKYRSLAEELLLYHQLGVPEQSATRLPAYPALLALAMLVTHSLVWLRLVNVLISSVLIGLVYGVAYHVARGEKMVATCSALICALDPTFVFFAPILASEHLFTALLMATLLVLLLPGRNVMPRALLAGALFGLAALTRGEGLFHLPTAFLALALSTSGWRRRAVTFVVFLLPVVGLTGAWAARNRALVGPGAGLSTTGGTNFYMAHNPISYGYESLEDTPLSGLPELEAHRRGYQLGMEQLKKHPFQLVRDAALGTKGFFSPGAYAVRISARLPHAANEREYPEKKIAGRRLLAGIEVLGYGVLMLLVILSLTLRNVPPGARALPLVYLAMSWLCYAVVFWANERYRFPAEAALCLLAGLGLSRILKGSLPFGKFAKSSGSSLS